MTVWIESSLIQQICPGKTVCVELHWPSDDKIGPNEKLSGFFEPVYCAVNQIRFRAYIFGFEPKFSDRYSSGLNVATQSQISGIFEPILVATCTECIAFSIVRMQMLYQVIILIF